MVKRVRDMETFIDNFEENRANELENAAELENVIMRELESIGKNLAMTGQLPSREQFKRMKSDLDFKSREMENSQRTAEGLEAEHARLRSDADKVDQLEAKIANELKSIQQKMSRMNDELAKFDQVEELKRSADVAKKEMAHDKAMLQQRREHFKDAIKGLSARYDKLKKALGEHETHLQLSNLEQKMRTSEQSNFQLRDYIASKNAESDYMPRLKEVTNTVNEYNKMLQKRLARA